MRNRKGQYGGSAVRDELDEYEDLKARHQRHNAFFRAVFLLLTGALGIARCVMLYYAFTGPYSLMHHAEAQAYMGSVWTLELCSVLSMALCLVYFLFPALLLLLLSGLLNVVLAAILIWQLVERSLHGWFWERGWWHLLYFPGFSLFYTAVTWYANVLIRDLDLEEQLQDLVKMTPLQVV